MNMSAQAHFSAQPETRINVRVGPRRGPTFTVIEVENFSMFFPNRQDALDWLAQTVHKVRTAEADTR